MSANTKPGRVEVNTQERGQSPPEKTKGMAKGASQQERHSPLLPAAPHDPTPRVKEGKEVRNPRGANEWRKDEWQGNSCRRSP